MIALSVTALAAGLFSPALSAALTTLLPYLGVLSLLLAGSAFFSGSEAALFSLDRYTLDQLRGDGEQPSRTSRRIESLLSNPRRLLATLLLGNEFINICISAVGIRLVLELKQQGLDVPWWTNILAVTPLLLVFGEIAPKAVAVRAGAAWSKLVALPLVTFGTLVSPARNLLQGLADLFIGGLGGTRDPLPDALQEAQFRALVNLSEQQGVLGSDEAELIHRVFELGDTPVSRIMTPRSDLVTISLNAPLDELMETARGSGFSRLPVYLTDSDSPRGVLLSKDLIRFKWRDAVPSHRALEEFVTQPYFVPPSKAADELLREFQKTRGHMAFVIDEYGGLQGIVTMQDILDELFEPPAHPGGLGDSPLSPVIDRIGEGVFRVPARLEVSEWNRRMHPGLPEGDSYTTVAGYIFHLFGRLPAKGEEICSGLWSFQVSGIDGTRLTQITAVRLDPRQQGGGE